MGTPRNEVIRFGAPTNGAHRTPFTVQIPLPPDRASLNAYELKFAVVKRVFAENGMSVSNAAIEEVVAQSRLAFPRGATLRQFTTPDGRTVRGYAFEIDREDEGSILAFRDAAQRITASGIPAVHEMTREQRWERVKEIFWERYAGTVTRAAFDEIFSWRNIGMMAGVEASLASPAGPFVIAGLTAKFTVVDMPRLHDEAVAVKRLTYAPEKPSDLEEAARRLAGLVQTGEIILGTAALAGGVRGGVRTVPRVAEATTQAIRDTANYPTAPAVVTPEGVRLPLGRAPSEPTVQPATPGTGASPAGVSGLATTVASRQGIDRGRPEWAQQEPIGTQYERRGNGVAGENQTQAAQRLREQRGFEEVIEPDKLTQQQGITNRPAADFVGFTRVKGGLVATVIEETTGVKNLNHLIRQLEGGRDTAQSRRGTEIRRYDYEVHTNNPQLIRQIERQGGLFVGRTKVRVIDMRGYRR